MLASCDRRNAIGRRDHAILTVLARLGLRAGEVAALQLEDIDWRAGELVVHGKGSHGRLPLPVLHHRDRARQRLLQPLPRHRRPMQQRAALRRPPRRRRPRPCPRRRPDRPALRRIPAPGHLRPAGPRPLDRRLRPALSRRGRPARRRHAPRRSTRRPPRRHLRLAGLRSTHRSPPPRRRPRRLALQRRQRPLDLRRQPRRPTADEIWALAKTRAAGVTRTDVRDLFSRNKKAREIERALTILEEAGRLQRTTVTDGRGRPAETWLPATPAQAA